MTPLLRRLARDRVSVALLVALLLVAMFIAWQVMRPRPQEEGHRAIATAGDGNIDVNAVVTSLADKPASRPKLALSHWTTANGARVYFVPAPELPMVDVRVVFDAGAARDGGLAGLARYTSAMIGEGTATRSADAIAEGFENIGAQFNTASYRDMAIAELRALTRPEMLTPALALFTDALANPSFPRDAADRIRSQMLVGLERDEEEPGTIASRSFMTTLYLFHPYGMPPEGTVDTLKKIRVEDLKAFHQRYYVAANAVIAITGALDRTQATQLAAQVSAALPAGAAAPGLPPPPVPKGGHYHVKFNSQQTHVFIGLPAIARNDPDEALLQLANQVLGGDGLSSILGEEVRNKRGLAYSVGSGFQPMRATGPFLVNLQTRNDQAGKALGVTLDVLARFTKDGPTQQQLDDARRQLVGTFPLQLAGNSAIVGTLGMMGFYRLPDDYLEQQLARIERATVDDVRKAFARHVPAAQTMIVTLGPEKPVPVRAGAVTAPASSATPAASAAEPPPPAGAAH